MRQFVHLTLMRLTLMRLSKHNHVWRLYSIITILFLSCFVSACSSQSNHYTVATPDGIASMGDISQTKYLLTTISGSANITFRAPATQTVQAPLDVLILFDRTASMKEVIDTTANAAEKIVSDVQKIAPNTRFAVAAVSDYSPLFSDDADKNTWQVLSDFSFKANEIQSASKKINLVNGGDTPEAYVRGFYEASEMAWRMDAKKIIIFFGDATAHAQDPGRDETLNTLDDLQLTDVISTLASKKITVIGIHTRNDDEVVTEFNRITTATRGKSVPLNNAGDSSSVIKNSITEALAEPLHMQASGDSKHWINITNSGNANPNKIDYLVNIKVPDDTPAGIYKIPLMLTAADANNQTNGIMKAFLNKPFEIKIITGWYNHPLILWLPLLSLILFLLYTTIRMLKGGFSQSRHVTSTRAYNADSYNLEHAVIDILAIASLICTIAAIYLLWTGQVLSQVL